MRHQVCAALIHLVASMSNPTRCGSLLRRVMGLRSHPRLASTLLLLPPLIQRTLRLASTKAASAVAWTASSLSRRAVYSAPEASVHRS